MEHELREKLPPPTDPAYEPPNVEQVIGPDELAREVQYAGNGRISP